MRALATWIGQLGFLIFFAAVVQILLPDNDVRKAARFATGLVLLFAVVEPVVGWLDGARGLAWLERSVESASVIPSAEPYVRRGEALTAAAWSKVEQQWRFEAERELAALLHLVPGVKEAQVELTAGPDGVREVEVRLKAPDAGPEELALIEDQVRKLVGGLALGGLEEPVTIVWER